jgi:hypothetical protein
VNATQFRAAFELADSDAELNGDLTPTFGFGLPDFQPVTVRLEDVAELIRWQGKSIYGSPKWDMEAVDEVRRHGRRKFIVV